jgi:hypothetical protein
MFGGFPYAGAPFADIGEPSQGIDVNVTGVSAVGVVGTVVTQLLT